MMVVTNDCRQMWVDVAVNRVQQEFHGTVTDQKTTLVRVGAANLAGAVRPALPAWFAIDGGGYLGQGIFPGVVVRMLQRVPPAVT
jgi:hypothetical protein